MRLNRKGDIILTWKEFLECDSEAVCEIAKKKGRVRGPKYVSNHFGNPNRVRDFGLA